MEKLFITGEEIAKEWGGESFLPVIFDLMRNGRLLPLKSDRRERFSSFLEFLQWYDPSYHSENDLDDILLPGLKMMPHENSFSTWQMFFFAKST